MAKNIIIDGRTLDGVTALKATDADSGSLIVFPDTSDANAIASDIQVGKTAYVDGIKLSGTNTGVSENDLDGLVDGSLVEFVMPSGKTTIAQYRFYQFTNLESANLGGAATVGQYAFDGCTKLSGVVMPYTLTNVGGYAFRNLGTAGGTTFELNPSNACAVGTYGFSGSRIAKVKGKYATLGTYAFSACTSLNEITIDESTGIGDYAFNGDTAVTVFAAKINGAVGTYAFYNLNQVASCNLDTNSVITSLGNYAFSQFASGRANAASNPITLDFSKSTFNAIPQYGFGGSSSTVANRNKYMKIVFPTTVATINAYAFRYTDYCDFYFTNSRPATLSATTCWGNATNYNIFVPFYSVNAYRNATNWTAQADFIKGFASENTFEVGATLPPLNSEGYGLTWFSDTTCTIPATIVEDDSTIYYCLVGTEKLAYGITSVTTVDCRVVISDGEKTYVAGEGVLTGTELSITGIPSVAGYIPYIFKVNGIEFNSGDTFTMTEDLSITAIYYDGQTIPIDPVFENNTWEIIYNAFRNGIASQFWAAGDTKPVILSDGNTYHIRIADMQNGRYILANGSGSSNGVLEFVECVPTSYPINNAAKEGQWTGGGWALSDMKNVHMETIFNMLPADLQSAISGITLDEYSYTAPTPRASDNKLFLPAETEVFAARHYAAEGTTGYPKYDQYDFYAAITAADNAVSVERQKQKVNTTASITYYLRSPYSGNVSGWCVVYSNGSYGGTNASYSNGVAPCFAI